METTILIIDDEPDMLEVLAYNLRRTAHRVITAANGREGLRCSQLALPDLIILDLMLPDLDGLAACEILRRLPSTRGIPILMITALSGQKVRRLRSRCEADVFMRKPFRLQTLLDQVDRMLGAKAVASHELDGRSSSPANPS